MKAALPWAVHCLLLLVVAGAQRSSAAVTPISKAVELLENLLEKADKEKHQEKVQFAAFKQFCDDVSVEKQNALDAMDADIERLQAKVQKHETDVERLGEEIKGLDEEIAARDKDLSAAAEVRESESANHTLMYEDYTESINALTQAISVLKAQLRDRPQAAVLLAQVAGLKALPSAAQRLITTFLSRGSEEPDLTFVAAPAGYAYEAKSHDIVAMLEQLKSKFEQEREQLATTETQRKHEYQMLVQDLQNSKRVAGKNQDLKSKSIASNREQSIESSSALKDVVASRDDDARYLTNLKNTCQEKADDFSKRQDLRSEEIATLEKALALLSSKEVSGAAKKHLPSASASSMLLQLGSAPGGSGETRAAREQRAAALLRDEADRLGSHALAAVALRAAKGGDPFEKVKRLIEELLQRLLAEEGEETEHKGWCDTELATNAQTRKSKGVEAEALRADIDGLEASIHELANDIVAFESDIAELKKDVANATADRMAESKQNKDTISEAVGAQASLAEAIKSLEDFYRKAEGATALLHRTARVSQEPPPIFDGPYKGLGAESGGVLALLDVIKSDFARLEASTKAAEASAQHDHDKFLEDSKILQVQKETDLKHSKEQKHAKEESILDKKSDLENAESQLSAALESYEKLKPTCMDVGMSYEERTRRRQDEIDALKQALRILEGEDISALQRS